VKRDLNTIQQQIDFILDFSSRSREYEDFYLLGYNAVYSGEIQPSFGRNITFQSSEFQSKPSKKLAINREKPGQKVSPKASPLTACFLLCLLFNPDDGSDMLLRNVS
jgi:hypothetical protein